MMRFRAMSRRTMQRWKMADILIKDMEKPKSCGKCPFFKRCANPMGEDFIFAQPFGDCLVSGKENVVEYDISMDCPLVEVPTHGELIDRQKSLEMLPHIKERGFDEDVVASILVSAPTVLGANNGHTD